MFNYLFGDGSRLPEKVDWMFTLNHIWLLLGTALVITLVTILVKKMKKENQDKFLLIGGITLVVLEISRILFKIFKHLEGSGTLEGFNWWWNISFQMCALMVWFTAINLIVFYFKKEDSKYKQIAYNIMFGAALIGASLSFLYPDMINEWHTLLYFGNAQTIVAHGLLILLPTTLVATGRLKVEWKNIGKVYLGLLGVLALAMPASLISGQNFAFMLEFGLLTEAGVEVAFPLHLFVLALMFFILISALYLPFEITRKVKTCRASKKAKKASESKKIETLEEKQEK